MKIRRLKKTKRIYLPSITPLLDWKYDIKEVQRFALAKQTSHITSRIEENESTLDLGCNLGFITLNVARQFPNNFVLGIEPDSDLTEAASRSAEIMGMKNVCFQSWEVTPRNVKALPSVDNVIFLSVFQQWVRSYGFENSKEMLNVLFQKTRKRMFFSMATTNGSPKIGRYFPDMGRTVEDSEEWIRTNILAVPEFELRTLDRIESTYEAKLPRTLFYLNRS